LLDWILEIFFGGQLITMGVQKFQREISYNPEERGEIFGYLFGVWISYHFWFYLQLFR